jgi:catechol 2,3-dioxygenase-like lactoylglutathione lyase family enzyme
MPWGTLHRPDNPSPVGPALAPAGGCFKIGRVEREAPAMIESIGVVHFSIPVRDLARSRRFYTELLGLTVVATPPGSGMAFLRAGADHVILCETAHAAPPNPGDTIHVHHAFRVDPARYEDAKGFLQSRGVAILLEEDRKSGVFVGRQFYFHDPDGNVIEISDCLSPAI